LSFNEIKELQQLLTRAGFNVGKIDGILGQQSRIAIKTMQSKFGLPADAWPTAELLSRLRGDQPQATRRAKQPARTDATRN
jgi:peptidoglycan hydrolase-like protein with peptidoglycan-binding domain